MIRIGKSRAARRAVAQSTVIVRDQAGSADRSLSFRSHAERTGEASWSPKLLHILLCELNGTEAVRLARAEFDIGKYAAEAEQGLLDEDVKLPLKVCRGIKGGDDVSLQLHISVLPLKRARRPVTCVEAGAEAEAAKGDTFVWGVDDYLVASEEGNYCLLVFFLKKKRKPFF